MRKLVSRRKILGFAGIALNFCAANQATSSRHAKNLLVCLVSKVVTWGSDCEDCEMIGTYCKSSCVDDDDALLRSVEKAKNCARNGARTTRIQDAMW